jgi:uncharacterized protein (TIGR04255 family)
VTWEPFAANHAIERVRIVVHFAQPIQAKQASAFAALIESRRSNLGFGPQISGLVSVVEIDANTGEHQFTKNPAGWRFLNTSSEGATIEALILSPQFLLYEAATYTRWAAFWERYDTITSEIRTRIHEAVNVRAVALEYVDRFRFSGLPQSAAPAGLIRDAIVDSLPDSARSGREPWHVHRGWFEGEEPHRFLVNQNIEAQTIRVEGNEARRGVGILTKVERQSTTSDLDISSLPDDIDMMHTLSKRVMRDALVQTMCERVGLQ